MKMSKESNQPLATQFSATHYTDEIAAELEGWQSQNKVKRLLDSGEKYVVRLKVPRNEEIRFNLRRFNFHFEL